MGSVACLVIDYEPESLTRLSLAGGESSFQRVLRLARSLDYPVFIFSIHPEAETHSFQGDLFSLMNRIDEVAAQFQHLLFLHSELPLLDFSLTQTLLNTHLDAIADYTLAEHYPDGFAPFVLNRGTFKKLQMMAFGNNQKYHRKGLDQMIQADINSYDVEIVIAPEDLRKIRENFSVSDLRSRLMCEKMLEKKASAETLGDFFQEFPEILRPFPAVIHLELSRDCQQACLSCPHTKMDLSAGFFPVDRFDSLLKDLNRWMETGRIELSGFGEPLTHPEFGRILEILKANPGFSYLLETNGLLLDQWGDKILEIPDLTVLISLDAPEKELYETLRGQGFLKAEENAARFMEKAGSRAFLQFTRMKENEEFLDAFLERWRAFQDRILIQKYNDFCGAFESRKVVDLSPLKRFACWKLQRELTFCADGEVLLCSQDFQGKNSLGNLFKTSLEELWRKSDSLYRQHWKNSYPGLCGACDQWYLYS